MIAIVNYNMGNLRSVENSFLKMGKKIDIIDDADKLNDYDKLILPGVGAFGDAMKHLKKSNLDLAIKEFAKSGKPLLGICLGMQLLLESSQEFGNHKGLSLIPGFVQKFDITKFQTSLKIPHMGWNKLFVKKDSKLFKNLNNEFYLYFVHSYHAVCEDRYILTESEYGYSFASSINYENIYGIQPHPEKSHNNGLEIIKNFMEL